jgi:PadR family transcriptional regulator PadR
MPGELLKGNLDLLLLSILTDGPAHGYAVVAELRRRSAGRFDLPEGTIYPALHRLETAGLLASRWSTESGRRRRTYSVSRRGQAELASRRREWENFTSAVAAVIA